MALKIEAEFDTRDLNRFLKSTDKKALRKSVARALNRTAITVRKEAAKEIRKSVRLPAKTIKESLITRNKARPNEPIDQQEVTIDAKAKPISLRHFKPSQKKKGVSVNITGKRQIIKRAFLAKGQVFRRVRVRKPNIPIKRVKGRSELPIEKQSYKSMWRLLENVRERLRPVVRRRFLAEFKRSFEYFGREK